jgi:hypothetical protein
LLSVARECRARGVRDARTLFRWALQPLLPPPALRVATTLRGGRVLRSYLQRQVPAWINPDFAREHGLHERARAALTRLPGESFSALESRYYLTHPYFPRVYACVSGLARDEGVEVRSPLLDPRVIAFAAERPREERASRAETKRVLRAAMRGIVPDEVLAPRRGRTGTTSRLLARALREHGDVLIAQATERSRLAELGVVEPTVLKRAWREWQSTHDGNLAVAIFLTVQAEFWVRSREEPLPRHECASNSHRREASAGVLS